jgi:hypothetical protein
MARTRNKHEEMKRLSRRHTRIIVFLICSIIFFLCSTGTLLYTLGEVKGYHNAYEAVKNSDISVSVKICDENGDCYVKEDTTDDNITSKFSSYLEYGGIGLYSDSTKHLNVLLNDVRQLNVSKDSFPLLRTIIFNGNNNSCNGYYNPMIEQILIYNCVKNSTIRDYNVSQEDFVKFALAHELGHYMYRQKFTDYDYQENWADEYAHETTDLGVLNK